MKNHFGVGDRIEVIRPQGNLDLVIEAMRNQDGEPVTVAPGSGYHMRIALPPGCEGAFIARYLAGPQDGIAGPRREIPGTQGEGMQNPGPHPGGL